MQEQQMWSETDVMTMRVNELDAVMSALGVGTDRGQPSGLDDVLSLAAGERQRLGELLCAAERVTPTQREEVLAEQRRSGRKLGEILIDRSNLAASECEVVLEFQRRLAGRLRLREPRPGARIRSAAGDTTGGERMPSL